MMKKKYIQRLFKIIPLTYVSKSNSAREIKTNDIDFIQLKITYIYIGGGTGWYIYPNTTSKSAEKSSIHLCFHFERHLACHDYSSCFLVKSSNQILKHFRHN